MTHVELVWVSFGRLLLQLLISEPQEVKEGARGGRWFQEMNPDPGNRATPPLGHTGLKGFLEVGNAHDFRSLRLGWPNITTFRLQRMNSVPCLQTPHLRLVWFHAHLPLCCPIRRANIRYITLSKCDLSNLIYSTHCKLTMKQKPYTCKKFNEILNPIVLKESAGQTT